jgi:hypothetical protein
MTCTHWRRVTRRNPCPICGHGDWCRVTSDGALAGCMRQEAGSYRAKDGRDGSRVYLHRLTGGPQLDGDLPPASPSSAVERADPDTMHRVYAALLAALPLAQRHREALHRRGLSDEAILHHAYATLPVQGRARLARDLRDRYGDAVLRVPGIITRERDGRRYLTLAGSAGLLIPVIDVAGRIVALLVRRDDGDGRVGRVDRPRYSYVSSTYYGGPGPGAPVHVPCGVKGPAEVVRVAEGVIKADVAQALSGLPTIGLPGVSTWRPVLPILRELGVRTVRLAFDRDAADTAHVGRALVALAEALAAEGYAVELERWPAPHKGIDDALAAGAPVEVLTGDAARQAIVDAHAEATAGEAPEEPGPLDRLAELLAEGGAEAIYRDTDVLRALARLAEENAAEFACRRAQLQRAGVRLRDLDKALAPLRQEIRREKPPPDAAGCYRVSGGRIVRDVLTKDGPVEVPLATWHGRIVEEVIRDDGAERIVTLAVEGALADGTPLLRTEVPGDEYTCMRWPVAAWGARAVVLAGASTADHLRCALQLLSGDVPRRDIFTHCGWRNVGGRWVYLHAGGAIGEDGPAPDVAVSLPDALAGYLLPDPPTGRALADAIRASLRVLDVAPDHITASVLGAVYRAVLGPADCALHLSGPTGAGKTELAALPQQHHGAGLDARHLPASWSSTGNSLEGVAFAAKDSLLTVDDFAPGGTTADVARIHREADRLVRAQGNQAGRMRMRADATLRPAKPPRGIILSTGEDVPRGQSLRARLLTLELAPGELDWSHLTACQRDAAAGLYASALAGYLRWLAARYAAIREGLRAEVTALRDRAHAQGMHARTPGALADLAVGWRYWLDYALSAGAIDQAEREALALRVWKALQEVGALQAEHQATAEPCEHFRRLLVAALASGRAHVAAPDGEVPADREAWGWRAVEVGTGDGASTRMDPQGRRIGWVDTLKLSGDGGPDLYLEPEAAYAEAQEMARHQGDSLPISPRTLRKRLQERGLLLSTDSDREVLTVRRTLQGKRRNVLHLMADFLFAQEDPLSAQEPDQPDQHGKNTGVTGVNGRIAGRAVPDQAENPTTDPTTDPTRNTGGNGELVGSVGSEVGGEAPTARNHTSDQYDEWERTRAEGRTDVQ